MHALKKTILVFGLAFLTLLSGCKSKSASDISTDIEKISISEVRESFSDDIMKIKKSNFDNISFENLSIYSFPEINTVHLLNVVNTQNSSTDELYNFMCEKIDELMPGKYTDEQKMNGIRFVDGGIFHEDAEVKSFIFPNIQEYKENSLESGQPWLIFDGEDHYFDVAFGWLRAFNSGAAAERSDYDDTLATYSLTSVYNDIVFYTADMNSEKAFKLSGGNLKINQAAAFVDDFFEKQKLSINNSNITFCSDGVKVIDMENGRYGYVFSVVGKYNGMKFNGLDMRESEAMVCYNTDTTNEAVRAGSICITEVGKVDYYNLVNVYDVIEEETYTSIISLNKAAEITSNYLTPGIKFKAKSVTAVYKEFSDISYSEYNDIESYMNREINVRPCWRFTLQPTTGNTNLLYHVFVDMLTGETNLLIQTVQKGLEYD